MTGWTALSSAGQTVAKYCAFFCEENIWQLAASMPAQQHPAACCVLLFFNRTGSIAVTNQRAFQPAGEGLWDYHVVLLDQHNCVHDFDTLLPSPVPLVDYLTGTFPPQQALPPHWRTTVRLVPAIEYIERFSSDRSHMLDSHGRPLAVFPDWPPIQSARPLELQRYISCEPMADSHSRLLEVDELLAELAPVAPTLASGSPIDS